MSTVDGIARHQARERALSLLYEAALKHVSLADVLEGLALEPDPFTRSLVEQVGEYRTRADELIGAASHGWPLERMAVLDRLVLELAVAELLAGLEPPVAVVIDEAVELAKTFSTDDSGNFVNGILSTIARQVR